MKKSNTYQEKRSANYRKSVKDSSFQFWGCHHPLSQTLWPRFVFKTTRVDDWYISLTDFPYFSLEIIISGKAAYRINKQDFIAQSGDLIIAPPNCNKHTSSVNSIMTERIGIEFYGNSLGSILEHLQLNIPLMIHLSKPDFFIGLLNKLYNLLSKREDGTEAFISATCYELLANISQERTPKSSPPFPTLLDNVLRAIHLDVSKNYSCAELAERANCSEPTLYRLFQEYLNTTPQNYITSYKMKQAQHMLQLGQASVKRVSAMLGYKDQFYFSRVYKKIHGIAPSKECQR